MVCIGPTLITISGVNDRVVGRTDLPIHKTYDTQKFLTHFTCPMLYRLCSFVLAMSLILVICWFLIKLVMTSQHYFWCFILKYFYLKNMYLNNFMCTHNNLSLLNDFNMELKRETRITVKDFVFYYVCR